VADGLREEEGLLRDEADVGSKLREGEGADGSAIDKNHAGIRILQTCYEGDEAGFS